MRPCFRKMILLVMLIGCAACLSACYEDVDPWPVNAPDVTAPAQEVSETQIPRTTATPAPESEDFWSSEPTEIPGGSEVPGVNG